MSVVGPQVTFWSWRRRGASLTRSPCARLSTAGEREPSHLRPGAAYGGGGSHLAGARESVIPLDNGYIWGAAVILRVRASMCTSPSPITAAARARCGVPWRPRHASVTWARTGETAARRRAELHLHAAHGVLQVPRGTRVAATCAPLVCCSFRRNVGIVEHNAIVVDIVEHSNVVVGNLAWRNTAPLLLALWNTAPLLLALWNTASRAATSHGWRCACSRRPRACTHFLVRVRRDVWLVCGFQRECKWWLSIGGVDLVLLWLWQ